MGEFGAGSVIHDGTHRECLAAAMDSASASPAIQTLTPDPFYENTEVLPMTTIDQQLAALLRKINKAQETIEKAISACDNADTDIRNLGNSTIDELTRDICYAGDKCITAKDYCEDISSMLSVLKDETYGLNSRLTAGAQPPAEIKPRHMRFLKVLKKNNGCTVAHMAGTLGVGMGAVYSYVHDLKQLGHKVVIAKKHLYLHDLVTNIYSPATSTGNNQEA